MKIIYLDTRETDDAFISYLIDTANLIGYDIEPKILEFGDINFQNIYIERKTSQDFCSSVCSDRLWEQAYKMKVNKDYISIIIISGGWDKLWKNSMCKIPQMEGAIIQLLAWGIPVLRVEDDTELVDQVLNIFKHSKPMEVPIKHIVKDGKISMFLALPGIGRKNGKVLMNEYDNMCELCEASKEELQILLGPKKGSMVFDALRE